MPHLGGEPGFGRYLFGLTNEKGNYNIEFVRVGTYNLSVERPGFQRLEKTGIVVGNNEVIRNDITLTLGVSATCSAGVFLWKASSDW
jgi:hypothetical protein